MEPRRNSDKRSKRNDKNVIQDTQEFAVPPSSGPVFRFASFEPRESAAIKQYAGNAKAHQSPDILSKKAVATKQGVDSPLITPVSIGWKEPQLTPVGLYYPLGPCQLRMSIEKFRDVLYTLRDVFRKLSVHAFYQDTPVSALCRTIDQVDFEISIFASRTKEEEIIVEIDRRCGDSVSYHSYARKICCALEGIEIEEEESFPTNAPCFWNIKLMKLADSIWKRGQDKDDDITEALELAWNLINNDRYDARRLGLESLIHITDPNKSSFSIAERATKSLMMPKNETEQRISRRLYDYVSQDTTSGASGPQNWASSRSESDFSYLSLVVAAQTFQVASESKGIDVDSFLHMLSAELSTDLVECLLHKMQAVRTNPHQAYYAVQSMVALCNRVPAVRTRVSNRDVEEAQLFGDSCHLALATASQKLALALQA